MSKNTKLRLAFQLLRLFRSNTKGFSYKTAAQFLCGLTTQADMEEFLRRANVREEINRCLSEKRLPFREIAKKQGCSESYVRHIWGAMCEEYPQNTSVPADFVIGIPKQKRAREVVEAILGDAGFRIDDKSSILVDLRGAIKPITFRSVRGSIIPEQLRKRNIHLAFVGNDKIKEAVAAARQSNEFEPVELEVRDTFYNNSFRMCLAVPKEKAQEAEEQGYDWFNGKTIATSYPSTLREELSKRGVVAGKIRYLDGDVEAAPVDFGDDAVMDIVQSGKSLRDHNLMTFDQPLYEGNISLIHWRQARRPEEFNEIMGIFIERVREAKQYAMAA